MQKIKNGTRYLLITCFKPNDNQFKNLYKLCDLIAEQKYFYHYNWQNEPLNLKKRRVLNNIFLFGHGAETEALITDNINNKIQPNLLKLPHKAALYSLVCYQGRLELKEKWAATGINITEIYGSTDLTETVLTILCLLHLYESKFENINYWYKLWYDVNDYLRKDFDLIIRTYWECNCIYKKTIQVLKEKIDYKLSEEYFEVDNKYFIYLDGLKKNV